MSPGSTAANQVHVLIPGLLRSYTGGASAVDVELPATRDHAGAALGDALDALDARYPGMRFRVIDEQGQIRPHIKMFIGNALARDLATALPAGSVLMIVGALSGG